MLCLVVHEAEFFHRFTLRYTLGCKTFLFIDDVAEMLIGFNPFLHEQFMSFLWSGGDFIITELLLQPFIVIVSPGFIFIEIGRTYCPPGYLVASPGPFSVTQVDQFLKYIQPFRIIKDVLERFVVARGSI